MEEVELEDFSWTLSFLSLFFPKGDILDSLRFGLCPAALGRKLVELASDKQVSQKRTPVDGMEIVSVIRGEDLKIKFLIKSQDTIYFVAEVYWGYFYIGKLSPEGGELKFLAERSFYYGRGPIGFVQCGGDLLFGNGEDFLTIDSGSLEIKRIEKYYNRPSKLVEDTSNLETYLLYREDFYLERKNVAGEFLLSEKVVEESYRDNIVVDFAGRIFLIQKVANILALRVFSPDFSLAHVKLLNYPETAYLRLFLSAHGEVYLHCEFSEDLMKSRTCHLKKVTIAKRKTRSIRVVDTFCLNLNKTLSFFSIIFLPPGGRFALPVLFFLFPGLLLFPFTFVFLFSLKFPGIK